ncbi:MAG: hypothetical protein RMK35_04360 [Aquificaceae bacterium]|nr:hypothetical protein [Aquificaceae bacterium]
MQDSERKRNIALITACGGRKSKTKTKAYLLYTSARIRHLYKQSKTLGVDFYILSAKYGLVHCEEEIEPYDEIMSKEKCKELKKEVMEKLKNFDSVVFYKGGARREYLECLEECCKELGIELLSFGFGQMGGIREVGSIIISRQGSQQGGHKQR